MAAVKKERYPEAFGHSQNRRETAGCRNNGGREKKYVSNKRKMIFSFIPGSVKMITKTGPGKRDPKKITVEELGLYMAGSKRKETKSNE